MVADAYLVVLLRELIRTHFSSVSHLFIVLPHFRIVGFGRRFGLMYCGSTFVGLVIGLRSLIGRRLIGRRGRCFGSAAFSIRRVGSGMLNITPWVGVAGRMARLVITVGLVSKAAWNMATARNEPSSGQTGDGTEGAHGVCEYADSSLQKLQGGSSTSTTTYGLEDIR